MNYNLSRLIITVILFSFNLGLLGQNYRIKGTIVDKKSNNPVSFASISINQHGLGTCSNIVGEFVFNYPDTLKHCHAFISCVGYDIDSIPLGLVDHKDNIIIYLEPSTYFLKEIIVSPLQLRAEEVLKLVVKNLRKNYNKKPYFMEGFIRDRVYNIRNNENTRLTEAAINIEKDELSKKKYKDKVTIVEIRNSYNYSKLQGRLIYNIKKVLFGWDDDNPIYKSLQYAEYTNKNTLKDLLKNDNYNFSISSMSTYEGESIVIINIKEEYRELFGMKYQPHNIYDLIKIYVNTNNYAIVKSEYISVNKVKPPFDVYLKHDTIYRHSVKQYDKIGNDYYLRYAGYYGKIHDQPSKENVDIYLNEIQLLINNIISNKKEFDRIKRKNLLKKDISLWDMKYTYHPEFWEDYNIILEKPLDQKVKSDLEHDIFLKEQFEITGSKKTK